MGPESGGGGKNRGEKEVGLQKNIGSDVSEIFKGMRVIFVGSDSCLMNELIKRGGMAISASHCEKATHVCADTDQKIISKEWLWKCCEHGMLFAQDQVSDGEEQCPSGVDEESQLHRENHQLFRCKYDTSPCETLDQYCRKRKHTLQYGEVIPGGMGKISFRTNKAGLSLCGKFDGRTSIIDECKKDKNVRFAWLLRDSLKNSKPDNDKMDLDRFNEMLRQEVFTADVIPHDMNAWLSLFGEPEYEDLLPQHTSLLDDLQAGEKLMSWYDTLKRIQKTKPCVFQDIILNLGSYNDWKATVRGSEGNTLLQETIKYGDLHKIPYPDDVSGLLKLMRNCRQHHAQEYFRIFVVIVCQNFPNLISDLQKELFKKGLL